MKGRKNASGGASAVESTMVQAAAQATGIEQMVERAVSQVLESQVPRLREELVRRVLEELQPQLGAASSEGSPVHLLKAVSAIHAGTSQREILRALLDGTAEYCGRVALFVVKAGAATGWQGREFSNHDGIKDFAFDVATGLAARAMQSRMALAGSADEIDPQFIARFEAPADDQVLILPLMLKDKIAALVYADAGVEAGDKMDSAALELLVAATSAWLEVASLRKQAAKDGVPEAAAAEVAPPPVAAASSFSDPFSSHAPKHTAPIPAPVSVEEPEPAPVARPEIEIAPMAVASAAAAPAPATDAFAQMSAEDADVHRKAQRFARLLVDEIKLYNQVKVGEGRKHKDLYDRLREDIEKSRGTYQKRYGSTVAASADYFSQELLRSLAEDDSSIMGANFRR